MLLSDFNKNFGEAERKKREEMVKMFDLFGVIEDMEGPDTAGHDVRGL